MNTILLVEDNEHIMKINAQVLAMRGYDILKASSVSECREILKWNNPDLIVLDIMLPDGDGISLCKEIKGNLQIPILFLSALGENQDIIDGLRAGGDDYLPKPYDLDIFVARVEARIREKNLSNRYLCLGQLKLDIPYGYAYLNDKDIELSPKEFSVLLLLTRNADNVVMTDEILRTIWQDNSSVSNKALWTAISRLRKKLDSENTRLVISSVRGSGYMLEQI